MSNFRDASRRSWNSTDTVEHINAGSLQRIADAAEKMAGNYMSLMADRDRYKAWYEREYEARRGLERRISAMRGVITKLKARVR